MTNEELIKKLDQWLERLNWNQQMKPEKEITNHLFDMDNVLNRELKDQEIIDYAVRFSHTFFGKSQEIDDDIPEPTPTKNYDIKTRWKLLGERLVEL